MLAYPQSWPNTLGQHVKTTSRTNITSRTRVILIPYGVQTGARQHIFIREDLGVGGKQMPLNNFSASDLGIKIHKLKNEPRVRIEEQNSRHVFLPVTTRSHDNWNKKILKITPPSSSLPIGDLYYCKKWYARIGHILSRKPGNILSRSGVAFVLAITSLMQQRPFRKP